MRTLLTSINPDTNGRHDMNFRISFSIPEQTCRWICNLLLDKYSFMTSTSQPGECIHDKEYFLKVVYEYMCVL